MAPDLRKASVYLSIFGGNETSQNKTFTAITHAEKYIQSLVADKLSSKFCPVLHFYMDEKFKKIMETMNLIDKAVSELDKAEQ